MHARFHHRCWRPALVALLLLAAGAACTDRPTEPPRAAAARRPSGIFDDAGNHRLAVGTSLRGVARLEVEAMGEGLGEPARWEFTNERPDEDEAWGGITLPRGNYELVVRGYDREGRELGGGRLALAVEGEVVRQVRAPVQPAELRAAEGEPPPAGGEIYVGSYRLAVDRRWTQSASERTRMRFVMHGADGVPFPIDAGRMEMTSEPAELGELAPQPYDGERGDFLVDWIPNGDKTIEWEGGGDPQLTVHACEPLLACATVTIVILPFYDSYVEVVASGSHACGLRRSGKAMCWGYDEDGVLAGGPTDNQLDRFRFVDLDVNEHHGCGVTTAGVAMCWGANYEQALGRRVPGAGVLEIDEVPAPIESSVWFLGATFKQVTVGRYHSCGLAVDGKAWCWGGNTHGQLGSGAIGGAGSSSGVVPVFSPETFTQLDAGDFHTCGITVTQALVCWGADSQGQTGDAPEEDPTPANCPDYHHGSYSCRKIPAIVGSLAYSAVSADGNTTCAIRVNRRQAYCLGTGIPGNGLPAQVARPTFVNGSNHLAVRAGAGHACLYDPVGLAPYAPAVCWGTNDHAQVTAGRPSAPTVSAPPLGNGIWSAGLGDGFTCAIDGDQTRILCWGRTGEHLGFPNNADVAVPTRVTVF